MGKLHYLNNSKSTSAMDIDPRPTSWNTLCPTFIDVRRTKLLQEESGGPVIGSPPPAGPPKVMWNEPVDVPNLKDGKANDTLDTAELSSRVQDIRLQPPQPMIICETVEDVNVNTSSAAAGSSVSLSVPEVDLSNEKKRPPY